MSSVAMTLRPAMSAKCQTFQPTRLLKAGFSPRSQPDQMPILEGRLVVSAWNSLIDTEACSPCVYKSSTAAILVCGPTENSRLIMLGFDANNHQPKSTTAPRKKMVESVVASG